MNRISCQKVNMLCFFLWLINKVYQKTMKVDLLIILYMSLIANFCIWTCITTLQIDINLIHLLICIWICGQIYHRSKKIMMSYGVKSPIHMTWEWCSRSMTIKLSQEFTSENTTRIWHFFTCRRTHRKLIKFNLSQA